MYVNKRADNCDMNNSIFREINRFSAKSFYTSSQCQMVPFNLLRISFSSFKFIGGNFVVIGIIIVRIYRSDIERF